MCDEFSIRCPQVRVGGPNTNDPLLVIRQGFKDQSFRFDDAGIISKLICRKVAHGRVPQSLSSDSAMSRGFSRNLFLRRIPLGSSLQETAALFLFQFQGLSVPTR